MIGEKLGKILVRGIAPEVLAQLDAMAKSNERSLEAEARYALRSWVQPAFVEKEQSVRREQLSIRLTTALAEVNGIVRGSGIRPSHLAKAIGEAYAEPAENWFLGREEPSFGQLEKIAEILGVNSSWLLHGDGDPFPVESHRLSEDPAEAARWLLDFSDLPQQPSVRFSRYKEDSKRIIFVRSAAATGGLIVVKQRATHRCITYNTPTNVSDSIGAGGEAQLRALFVTLELLYKVFGRGDVSIQSWVIPDHDFLAIIGGEIHPLSVEKQGEYQCPWWEDIWDEAEVSRRGYWDGWQGIAARIQNSITRNTRLNEFRSQVRDGTHPSIADLRKLIER